MPELSIIIPTHQRAEILRLCLEHLEAQTIADQLEVIVISDGPDEQTALLVEQHDWHIPITYSAIPKSQQGVARNAGMHYVHSPIVLFIGDDALLEPTACELHLRIHENRNDPTAVLGFTTWDPSVGITPVMQWLEKSGWQFGYPHLTKYAHDVLPAALQHRYTYTIHISLPTEIAKRLPFREDAHLYGWEDVEWGKSLAQMGVPLYYEPDAIALHHHAINLDASLRRMETLGQSVLQYPDLGRIPTGWKLLAYKLTALLPTMAGRHRKAFLRGMSNPTPNPQPPTP